MEDKESEIERAIEQTKKAEESMKEIENILKYRPNIDDRDVWEVLEDKSKFPKPKPQPSQLLVVPPPPKETDKKYEWYGNIDIRNSKMSLFKYDYNEWLKQKEEILKKNAELERQYQDKLKQWEAEKQEFLKKQQEKNYAIDITDAVWKALKDTAEFPKPKPEPQLVPKPQPPQLLVVPQPPTKGWLFEVDYKWTEQQKECMPGTWKAHKIWIEQREAVLKKNAELERQYQDELKQWELKNTELEKEYQNELKQWEAEEQEFLKIQQEKNNAIDKLKEQYLSKIPNAIVEYCKLVLLKSEYPDYSPKEFDIDYNPETKILIVDYSLPSVDSIPRLKEVKYVKSRDECVEVFHTESFINKLYDSLVYQITLRTIHELYEFDVVNALDSIVFNGWVKSIDKATGQEVNACILSLQANRQEFLSINLTNVDPKACFRHLKGVGSSKLHSLTPVVPILSISREDKRFISSYAVADELDESMNLAAMDWEDFEHLIRELFEKEFAQYGGEVKVTQASRDGGVDAIAFDPDPIRGGKIVIQAKRYTNTVGVSAVRDLYGTVINEGATKGILITTADYGPDVYEFAKGKPLTLFNGSHLLHLLEKHGHRAKIDLKAAKEILSEREKKMRVS